ncbi:uncharacterized protein LOC116574587 isoform X2 [Mustela erminea]|uniref:uncharacterized protein LOC116574587 isoform X2 n=1 Tax=Mustela erminea TaxID=36723 RepID=UPI0013869FCC|nr:uncharacterized protein LOC116574587 isoform X2 [Mustela erminea]
MTSSKILNHQCRLKGSYLPATHFMSLVSNIPGVTLSKSKTSRRGEADLGSGGFLTGAERKGKKTFSSSSLPGKQPFLDDGLGPAFPPGTSTCRHYISLATKSKRFSSRSHQSVLSVAAMALFPICSAFQLP